MINQEWLRESRASMMKDLAGVRQEWLDTRLTKEVRLKSLLLGSLVDIPANIVEIVVLLRDLKYRVRLLRPDEVEKVTREFRDHAPAPPGELVMCVANSEIEPEWQVRGEVILPYLTFYLTEYGMRFYNSPERWGF